MPWDLRKKVIFIHIPKTGGTKFEHEFFHVFGNEPKPILGHGVLKTSDGARILHHLYSDEIKNILDSNVKIDYDDCYIFSIVRNPYTRFLSDYYWNKMAYKAGKSVDEFLSIIESGENFGLGHIQHFCPQSRYLFDDNNDLIFPNLNLFKFETFNDIIDTINNRFNCKINYNKVNQNTSRTTVELTGEQKERLYKLYEIDFKNFKYDK